MISFYPVPTYSTTPPLSCLWSHPSLTPTHTLPSTHSPSMISGLDLCSTTSLCPTSPSGTCLFSILVVCWPTFSDCMPFMTPP